MTDPMMRDILSLIDAIDAVDGTPVGQLDAAMNRIGDRASMIRYRRKCELEQLAKSAEHTPLVTSAHGGSVAS